MTRLVLALDQGTTSSRSILFDHAGNIVAVAQREFEQHFPRSGWVKHDPDDIWASQAATMAEVMARANVSAREISAIGITNQRETTVLWDRATGRPVARAIVWQDRRTADACDRLRAAGHEPEVMRRTGLVLDPYFSGTKLAWLLDNVPGARARAELGELAFGTVDSWLAFKLSDHRLHVTDATNASRTMLCNLATGDWDPVMLEMLDIPRACLPEILPSSIPAGTIARGEPLTVDLGGYQVPLGGIAGDQQAALFGQACFKPGMAKNTYGTGCFLLMNSGRTPVVSENRLLTTIGWRTDALSYALEGSVFVGGAVVQWLRDGALFADDLRIDLVYNRLTDFYLAEARHDALRRAYEAGIAVVTPHPAAHARLADKRLLAWLCDDGLLQEAGLDEAARAQLRRTIPPTEIVDPAAADDLWKRRKELFFKPVDGYAGKAAYRGDKLTRATFAHILSQPYVAQAVAPTSMRRVIVEGEETDLRVDVRNFCHGGETWLRAARLYRGQTTNFRTPGGGFAPVLTLSSVLGPSARAIDCACP